MCHQWWSAQWRALCTKISEVNLYAFIYRLFHEGFSSIFRTNIVFVLTIEEKFSWNSLQINTYELTSEIFVKWKFDQDNL